MDASVLFSIEDQVACITLNRPAKLNSFNREMALLLQQLLHTCHTSPEVRCVHITGAGKGFSAGQDLAEVTDPDGPGMQRILSEHYNPVILQIRRLGKPVVAAVNGVAAGAGANIALCCDIVLAAENASFIQAFSKIGLIPDSGGTFFLPRLIGWQKASALAMLGDKVSAAEAAQMGMIYKTLPEENFTAQTMAIAKQLATMPTHALALIKQAMNSSLSNTLETQLHQEDQLQQQAARTADFKEGIQAFMEKRTPVFTGS
ncbi:enoyl-CoA hydratase-related protein [Deminuibacter soli]|uniref:2-(1,2-epoxy-1,2-dihydrophenyl)acetyl-CoA isomerase n=1 Tax=Deminuibacter soli TaxID=2291815 RepID=A0A3E1NQ50_9BACT|nr:enoyl-CoA hydratase-related protein [Deminuibacter soli]RFM29944.1 2-(1,2-epoxy-1,2-dihydrophenyl)acetyl-CoA isomerase [Deminuibacter soli]